MPRPPIDLSYARALVEAVPARALVQAAVKRALARPPGPRVVPPRDAIAAAADALGRAPALFSTAPLGDLFAAEFPDGIARLRAQAERILDGEVELFGRPLQVSGAHHGIDWLRDPVGGARLDGDTPAEALDPTRQAADPKPLWELARGAHLVQLGAAARLVPALEEPVRARISSELSGFLSTVKPGRGVHYVSPLEVALRSVHWLGALELCGGARVFSRVLVERLAERLLHDAWFLATHLEDGGVAPANHLLGDLTGLFVLGLALDGAPGGRTWADQAGRALAREAERQVGADGAHFEASTGYHRFALELLCTAWRAARSRGVPLSVGEPIHRMMRFLRGTLAPDGHEAGFGDADDARVLPIVARAPRDHAYLLSVGVGLFGDPGLKPPWARLSEEALFWLGPDAARAFHWVPVTADAPSASFRDGGVHVMRMPAAQHSPDVWVAMRAGSYGQLGVGGHAHNDQLSFVLHAAGRPVVIDPGTGCYTADRLLRDRLRSTAAHATLVVDGTEQSPLHEARPFALPDRAHTRPARLEDACGVARLSAEHRGYRRLPQRVVHRRTLTLDRAHGLLLVDDELRGRGRAAVELRFPLACAPQPGASEAAARRLVQLRHILGDVDPATAVQLGVHVVLVCIGPPLEAKLREAPYSPRYGTVCYGPLVSVAGLLTLPTTLRHAFLFFG